MAIKRVLIVSIIAILGGIVLYRFNPAQYWFMPKCMFKVLTGLSCPGCGLQRAIFALLHGHVAEAISYNYYLIYAGPYALSFVGVWLLRDNTFKKRVKDIIENRYVVYFYLVTFILWLVIRNILNI